MVPCLDWASRMFDLALAKLQQPTHQRAPESIGRQAPDTSIGSYQARETSGFGLGWAGSMGIFGACLKCPRIASEQARKIRPIITMRTSRLPRSRSATIWL
jgi:hypothetical protein